MIGFSCLRTWCVCAVQREDLRESMVKPISRHGLGQTIGGLTELFVVVICHFTLLNGMRCRFPNPICHHYAKCTYTNICIYHLSWLRVYTGCSQELAAGQGYRDKCTWIESCVESRMRVVTVRHSFVSRHFWLTLHRAQTPTTQGSLHIVVFRVLI
jgi:hypothetical protein